MSISTEITTYAFRMKAIERFDDRYAFMHVDTPGSKWEVDRQLSATDNGIVPIPCHPTQSTPAAQVADVLESKTFGGFIKLFQTKHSGQQRITFVYRDDSEDKVHFWQCVAFFATEKVHRATDALWRGHKAMPCAGGSIMIGTKWVTDLPVGALRWWNRPAEDVKSFD